MSEVEKRSGGTATLISIQATVNGVVRYLCDKLMNNPTPKIINSTSEAEIRKSISIPKRANIIIQIFLLK